MKTTLDIEDDVLELVIELAEKEKCTLDAVISRLIRQGLRDSEEPVYRIRNGVPIIPSRGEKVTAEKVAELIGQEGF